MLSKSLLRDIREVLDLLIKDSMKEMNNLMWDLVNIAVTMAVKIKSILVPSLDQDHKDSLIKNVLFIYLAIFYLENDVGYYDINQYNISYKMQK